VDAADDRARRRHAAEEAMSTEQAVAAALRRSAIYRLLATAFAYPTPARLEHVASRAAQAGADAPPGVRAALDRLAGAARGADAATLAGDHVDLFQRQVRCPPYEGAYGAPQMSGKSTLLADIAGFYLAFGLTPAEAQPEVEDHVCAETEFMSALALKEAWALAEGHAEGLAVTRDAARAFLRDHLARWSTTFVQRLADLAPPGFYPAAAALLEEWLKAECARLEVEPAPLVGVTAAEEAPFACPMAPASTDAE
jgi:DMSO reductase family type II enzyme chaperone